MNHMPLKILLFGKGGQLGWEFQRTLASLGSITALDWPEVDFSQPDSLRPLIREIKPQVIINAVAYTAVDRAESEPQFCRAINATAPGVLAEEARELNAALIHYSTDYVFDGEKGASYSYSEEDAAAPLNTYGVTKLEGEQKIQQIGGTYWILRTSWVYSLRKDSFVTKVLGWARQQTTLKVVSDQVGAPTWCRMLAEISTQALIEGRQDPVGWVNQTNGLYHLGGDGAASRLDWAKAILDLDPKKDEQTVKEVLPAKTADFPTPARRPLYTPIDCGKFERTFGLRLPPWQTALRLLMEQL